MNTNTAATVPALLLADVLDASDVDSESVSQRDTTSDAITDDVDRNDDFADDY